MGLVNIASPGHSGLWLPESYFSLLLKQTIRSCVLGSVGEPSPARQTQPIN